MHRQGCHVNGELGRSHKPIPVVHTKEVFDQVGVYLYYARGCSNVMWDPGRTIAASNRLQLAVELTRLDQKCKQSEARKRVVQWILAPEQHFVKGRGSTSAVLRQVVEWEELCTFCSPDASWNRIRKTGANCADGTRFAGWGGLDQYNLPLMKRLGFDSAQLIFQPAGGAFSHVAYTELWDIRNASSSLAQENDPLNSIAKHLSCRGNPCVSQKAFARCLHCKGCESGCAPYRNSSQGGAFA